MKTVPKSIFLYLNAQGSLAIGDAIVHLPVVRTLREWAPRARIVVYPLKGGVAHLASLYEPFINEAVDNIPAASGGKFDWVFDLVGESIKKTFILRSLAQKRFFTTAGRGFWNLPNLPLYHGKYIIKRHLGLVHQATGHRLTPMWPWPLPLAYKEAAASLLPSGPRYAALAPGAGNAERDKRWPVEQYVALAQELAVRGYTVLVILGPMEAGWEEKFKNVPGVRFPLAENQARSGSVPSNPTFTVALASRVSVGVTNCCGAGHMFALGGAPLVSIFGPTNYLKSAAYAKRSLCVLPSVPKSKRVQDVSLPDVLAAVELVSHPEVMLTYLPSANFRRVSYSFIEMNP